MIDKKKKYKLGDFNYRLPKKFIAQHPHSRRDFSRLMVVNRSTGKIEHRKFLNITDYMRKNDLMVVNNTKVFPARLFATKDRTAAKVEVFLLSAFLRLQQLKYCLGLHLFLNLYYFLYRTLIHVFNNSFSKFRAF